MKIKTKLFIVSLLIVVCTFSQETDQPIRGVWVTNVGSKALYNETNVKAAIAKCKDYAINNIYVVVWNGGATVYPSAVVEKYIGVKQLPGYKAFDPLKLIVEEGHKAGMKVHAWFEFGFSYAYQDATNKWNKKYPHWAGRDSNGKLLQKNKFFWWSALHPEVQQFMHEMILEVVKKYDVDGIQGDDRLPAMPAEGGYDDYTLALYKKETGLDAPLNCRENKWLQWKADKLSAVGKSIYDAVKKARKDCIVSWAPSIYPWSKEQYLQDWPAWLNGGYADYIFPQLYRYDIKAYEKVLNELASQITEAQKKKIVPGVLASLGDGYIIKEELLKQTIRLNRQYGFTSECFFYFETLNQLPKFY